MICGASAHDHSIPLGLEHRTCALDHLEQEYAFVAVTERYAESVCLLAELVGIPPASTKVRNDKATTGSKGAPADFKKVMELLRWAKLYQYPCVCFLAFFHCFGST